MGETRVDLLHLLEDLRDAHLGSMEETILTEIIANSLDSGAATIRIEADPAASAVHEGSGTNEFRLSVSPGWRSVKCGRKAVGGSGLTTATTAPSSR